MIKGLIVIDGPDASGKTTLAKELIKQAGGGKYFHSTYYEGINIFLHQARNLRDAIEASKTSLAVIDRLWISEVIYSGVFRGGTKVPAIGSIFERVLLKHSALTILAIPEKEKAMAKFEEMKETRTEMYDNMSEVWDQYKSISNRAESCNHLDEQLDVSYRYTSYDMFRDTVSLEEKAKSFLEKLQKIQQAQHPLLANPDVMASGHAHKAKVLIIGERANTKLAGFPKWPFFEYEDSNVYLTQQIEQSHFIEDEIVYVNALDTDPEDIRHLAKDKNLNLSVLAMGKYASYLCKKLDIENFKSTHTLDWHCRFNKSGQYAKTISQLLQELTY